MRHGKTEMQNSCAEDSRPVVVQPGVEKPILKIFMDNEADLAYNI
jgi:hypothetical protein